jgi:hypothetical protein
MLEASGVFGVEVIIVHSLFPGTADKPREWEAAAYPVPLLSALAKN